MLAVFIVVDGILPSYSGATGKWVVSVARVEQGPTCVATQTACAHDWKGYDIERRLAKIFLYDENGKRAVYGGTTKFQEDPHWRDYILFYEYFHGDNGAGLGTGHQTGWTGLVARALDMFARMDSRRILETSKNELVGEMTREQVVGS